MKLEEYLHYETEQVIVRLNATAPVEICPCCCVGEGHMVFDNEQFKYQCPRCKAQWPADALEIDKDGNFELIEWAD
jgi:hypothetical protein